MTGIATQLAIEKMRDAADAVTIGLRRAGRSLCALARAVFPLVVIRLLDGSQLSVEVGGLDDVRAAYDALLGASRLPLPHVPGPDGDADAQPATVRSDVQRCDGVGQREVSAAPAVQEHGGRRSETGAAGGAHTTEDLVVGHDIDSISRGGTR